MKNRMLREINVSLRLSFIAVIVGTVIVTCVIMGIFAYSEDKKTLVTVSQNMLESATSIAVLAIDPMEHASIKSLSDEQGKAYQAINDRLQMVKQQYPQIKNVYTLRMKDNGEIYFVVDSEKGREKFHHFGDNYSVRGTNLPATDVFKKPFKVSVGKEIIDDGMWRWITGCAPILHSDGSMEGCLCMDIPAETVNLIKQYFRSYIIFTGLIACFAGILIAVFLSRKFTRSLLAITGEMSRIKDFHLDDTFKVKTRIKEVKLMSESLIAMKHGISSFARYVPSDLVRHLIKHEKRAELGAERKELTLMFTDIANFTSISENMDSDTLASYLSVYFKGMAEPIMQNNGTVDKYMGDAIMAFWGAPEPVKEHALLACRAAIQCGEFLQKMAGESKTNGLPPLYTRFGINTGEVIVGNFGYDERLNYTAMGDHVNLASRLEGLNRKYGTQIIISEYTHKLIKDDFVTRPIDKVAVKGRKAGVNIYELVGRIGRSSKLTDEFLRQYDEAYECYSNRRWDEACNGFSKALLLMQDDKPTQILLNRCLELKNNPPPEDWDGVTVFHEK